MFQKGLWRDFKQKDNENCCVGTQEHAQKERDLKSPEPLPFFTYMPFLKNRLQSVLVSNIL